jgi:hypothetical protein
MTTVESTPRDVALTGPDLVAARRLYARNLCRHCGCFAHLTLKRAARKLGLARAIGASVGAPESEPHPLGDRAGRIAYALRLERRRAIEPCDHTAVLLRLAATKITTRSRQPFSTFR